MPDFATTVLSVAMVFGPIIGYVDQYRLIIQKKSSAGFNSKTCAILLFANILRIFFWLGKRFDTTLLAQSIAMILAQLILLHIVVRYRHDPSPTTLYSNLEGGGNSSSSSLSSLLDEQLEAELDGRDTLDQPASKSRHCSLWQWHGLKRFWSWEHYLDYLNCLLIFTTVVGVLYLFLHRFPVFVEILGVLSLGIESTLPLPQCISNFMRKGTAGFSLLVLGSWFLGDSFKLFYFIHTHAPAQFDICGGIQLGIDTVIVFQFIFYSSLVQSWWEKKAARRQPQEDDQEPDTEPVSSHLTHDVGSPTVPPPQYNEQQGFVVDTGKAQIDSGSKSRPDDGEKQPSQAPAFTLGAVSTTTATTTMTTTNMTAMEEEEDSTVWPIFIRPSISGKDISVDLPRTAPFWTLHQLRQHIEPQLQTTTTPLRIRFIYLGKILPESTTLIPNASTSSSASGSLLLDKQAVIQAMVSTNVESP